MTSSKLKPFQELHLHGGIQATLLMRHYGIDGGWLFELTVPDRNIKGIQQFASHKTINKMLRAGCTVIRRVDDCPLTDEELLEELGY